MASELTNSMLRKLAALRKLGEFAWFLEVAAQPLYDAADKKLRAPETPADERHTAAQTAHALRKVLDWSDEQWAHYSAAEQRGE